MANTLMFEVGVQEAGNQLSNLENRLKGLVDTYGSMKIKVEVDNLKDFVNALKTIGNGDQLKPLLDRIDSLQTSLTKINSSMGNVDLSSLKKQLNSILDTEERIKKTTDDLTAKGANRAQIISSTATDKALRDTQLRTLEKNFGMTIEQAKHYIKTAESAGDTTTKLEQKIEGLSQSITALSGKTFSVNMGNEFKTWSEQVQALVAQVKELVAQFEKLHQVQNTGGSKTQTGLFEQTKFNTLQESIDKIISEINRLQQAFTHLGENNALSNLTTYINGLAVTLGTLSNSIKLQPLDEQTKRLIEENEKLKQKLMEVAEASRYINVRNGDRTQDKVSDIQKIAGATKEAAAEQEGLTNKQIQQYSILQARIEKIITSLSNLRSSSEGKYYGTQLDGAIKSYTNVLSGTRIGAEFDLGSDHIATLNRNLTLLAQQYANVIKGAKEFNKLIRPIGALDNKLSKLEARKAVDFAGLDTTKLDAAINKIRAIRDELANFAQTGKSAFGNTPKEIMQTMGLEVANREATMAMKTLNQEKTKGASATSQLTAEEQKLAQAISHSTGEMGKQSQILSDLKMMATQYLSVWGAQNFVNNIIETGGLLEQQRLSIGAILGDMEQAATLFGQIKNLALKSPFGVVELDKMSKQLTAYGFEYKELYDWTKRLADISAATGTEVSRLSLALGHVRSEGALSGYTLRQFAMANVPVLRMLSENLGISTKEVRERVRKKEISYDDVKDILKQLTNEGGMFYNAQEVMSQALNAKFKNLRDAFDIMYNEIAEGGVGDALKQLAEILTAGAKHWERLGTTILEVGAAFGVSRIALLLYNRAIGEGTVSTLKSIAAAQQKEKAHLRLARAAGLVTKAEYKQLIYNEQYSASGLKVALVEKRLTIEELQRAVALGKVKKATAEAAVVQAGYDAQLIRSVTVLSGWRKGLFLIGEGFRAAITGVKGFFAAAWPLLALTAVFELANRTSENNDKAKSAAEGAAKATNKYSDLQAVTERLGSSQDKTNDQLTENISEMEKSLKAVGEYNDELKKQIDAVDGLAEKYEILRKKMKDVSDQASSKQERKQAIIQEGLSAGSGTAWLPWNWFRDNALKDAKDIDDYAKELSLAFDKNERVLNDAIEKYLRSVNKWKKEFETMSARDIFMSLTENDRDDFLYDFRFGQNSRGNQAAKKAAEAVSDVFYGNKNGTNTDYSGYSYRGALDELKGHKEELSKAFADAFKVDFPKIDLSKATTEQKIEFDKWLSKTIGNFDELKEEGQKALMNVVIEGTIKVRPKYALDNQSWQEFLDDFKTNHPIAYEEWSRHGESLLSTTEEERRKSAESYKRTFSGSSLTSIGNDTKKRKKELEKEEKNLNAFKSSIIYKESKEQQDRTNKRLAEIAEEKKRISQAQKDYNQYGDPEKEDKALKRARTRLEEVKSFLAEYKKFYPVYGKEKSISLLEGLFPTLEGQGNNIVDNYKGILTRLRNSLPMTTDERKKFGLSIDNIIADTDLTESKKAIDKQLSDLKEYIQKKTDSWNLYKTILEKTGDKDYAMNAFKDGKLWDEVSSSLAESLRNAIKDAGSDIDIDSMWGMTDASANEMLKGINGGYELWKKIVDLLSKNYTDALSKGADAMAQQLTIAEKIAKIDAEISELQEKRAEATDIGIQAGYDSQLWSKNKDRQKLQTELFESSEGYLKFYSGILAMTSEEAERMGNSIKKNLIDQLASGSISADKYAKSIRNIDEQLKKARGSRSAFVALASGGVNGMMQRRKSIQEDEVSANAIRVQKAEERLAEARKNLEEATRNGNEEEIKAAQLEVMSADASLQSAENQLNSSQKLLGITTKQIAEMDSLLSVLNLVSGVINGLQQAASQISEMFKALGKSGAANQWSDIADIIGVVGSPVNSAVGAAKSAMNGDVGGVIGGAVGIFTSPFTAAAKLHDKQNERQIQALKEDVAALEANTAMLKTWRGRTLGYDSGSLVKALGRYYSSSGQGAAGEALADWYGSGKGNGYSQELENLKKQRQDYIDMYNEEEDKKDSSSESLLQYKQKIAELDDQILNYVNDLSKELWAIDIKGWADQISDSLTTAFENGENAAQAFRDSVNNIMRQVVKEVLKLGIVEPMMKDLQQKLFGTINPETGEMEGGIISQNEIKSNPAAAGEKAASFISDYFKGEGNALLNAYWSGLEGFEKRLNEDGFTLKNDSSSSAGKSIKSEATEESIGVLTGYIASMRQDTSMNRLLNTVLVNEIWPDYLSRFDKQRMVLDGMFTSVKSIESMMSKGNGAMYDTIESIDRRLNKVVTPEGRIRVV